MTMPPPAANNRSDSSPTATDGPRIPLYSSVFAEDPHGAYREMRERYGALVPVDLAPGVPATLVIGYYTAVRIFNDPDHFPADPRIWEQNIPTDCPVLPMMQWRPNALYNTGLEHARYRQINVAGLGKVDQYSLHDTVERIAIPLTNTFCADGAADLVHQYAFPLAFAMLNALLGCPAAIAQQAASGMAAAFEGIDAERGNKMIIEALLELTLLKRVDPGDDITTRMMHHPAGLSDTEMVHQLTTLYGAGIEPLQHLIANTMLLILTDERFGGSVLGGSLSTRDALDEVLFNDPPLANFCISYPRQPILIDGIWLPAHQPVVISMSACNNDPQIRADQYVGNRSHLAWGAGPHVCPANSLAYLVAQNAIDQLLDALPEIRLAVAPSELIWRPGPFHRALTALPVVFPKSAPLSVV